MKIERVSQSEEETTLKIRGTIFFINANRLCEEISKSFEISHTVTVEMSEIERIDETTLEKIVTLNKRIKSQGKSLELVGYNEKIRIRLDKFFKVL